MNLILLKIQFLEQDLKSLDFETKIRAQIASRKFWKIF